MTDAEGLTTTYTYDALGRTICETRPGFRGALLITSNEGEPSLSNRITTIP